jgi:hypothetical protein
MDIALAGLQWQQCIVYIDDVIIYSRGFDEHIAHLQQVMGRLLEVGVRLKLAKCHFACQQVTFLGHRVSANCLRPDPDKVKAMVHFPVPHDITSLRRFLGLTSYYRRLIQGFADLAYPLYYLLKNDVPWVWTEDCQAGFDSLREALVSDPVLALPDFYRPFKLTTDASYRGLGAVLEQLSYEYDPPVYKPVA